MSPTKDTRKTAKRAPARAAKAPGFTADERAAMQERARELKAAARRGAAADVEKEVLAKLAEMKGADRTIGQRLHAIVKASAPTLEPKLWYGMPAYARDGKVVCFFQSAGKFRTRYATLGFSDQAALDEGAVWPVVFAVKELGATEEARITALVKKAAG